MAAYSMGRKRVIAVLALTSILLITLDQRGTVVIDRARSLFHLVIEPFDTAARTITRPVLTAWRGVFDYRDLERENEVLRAEIEAQRGAFIEAKAAIYEYQELLALNRLVGTGGFPSVTAQVQGGSPGNFQNTVEINKGGIDGIAVGMPVVNGAGLVGKVTRVFPSSAIVQLVVDPGFSMRAKVLTPLDETAPGTTTGTGSVPSTTVAGTEAGTSTSTTTTTTTVAPTTTTTSPPILLNDPLAPVPLVTTTTTTLPPALGGGTTVPPTPVEVQRETGTVVGQGVGRPLLLRFVDDSATTGRIEVGSTVETAGGLQSLAPPGIPIGTVSRVAKQSGSRVPIIEVEIGAGDLSRLNFLVVLLYVPNTGAG